MGSWAIGGHACAPTGSARVVCFDTVTAFRLFAASANALPEALLAPITGPRGGFTTVPTFSGEMADAW